MSICPSTLTFTLALGLATATAAQANTVKLKPEPLRSAATLPLNTRHPINDKLPEVLVGSGYTTRLKDRDLEISTKRDGRFDKKVSPTKPTRLVLGADTKTPKSIFVFKVFDTWYAASASTLTGRYGKRTITLLDADLDGKFDSPHDYIRFGAGSFHAQHANRLLAERDVLLRYTLDPSATLTVRPVAPPARSNALQWRALLATNSFRASSGLTPFELDLRRCDGCQKHAEYLLVNNYDYKKPWDGVGSHDEIPGKPGYTKEGHEAAHKHATSSNSDPADAVLGQTLTMLHRTCFLGAVEGGLGVGAVDRSNVGSGGYSVVGGDDPEPAESAGIVVIPAPGQRDVPHVCRSERPPVERDPAFYQRTRGYPISVSFGKVPLTKISIDLYKTSRRRDTPVRGTLFSPEAPIHSSRQDNARSAFFVADGPLERKTTYRVRFRAQLEGKPFELAWEFST
ncbi:MAG: hypothetical protein H6836_06185 [Planctomycetes bacterium]|nr:hypothetical protein [Planctomycetota bacterium]